MKYLCPKLHFRLKRRNFSNLYSTRTGEGEKEEIRSKFRYTGGTLLHHRGGTWKIRVPTVRGEKSIKIHLVGASFDGPLPTPFLPPSFRNKLAFSKNARTHGFTLCFQAFPVSRACTLTMPLYCPRPPPFFHSLLRRDCAHKSEFDAADSLFFLFLSFSFFFFSCCLSWKQLGQIFCLALIQQ